MFLSVRRKILKINQRHLTADQRQQTYTFSKGYSINIRGVSQLSKVDQEIPMKRAKKIHPSSFDQKNRRVASTRRLAWKLFQIIPNIALILSKMSATRWNLIEIKTLIFNIFSMLMSSVFNSNLVSQTIGIRMVLKHSFLCSPSLH